MKHVMAIKADDRLIVALDFHTMEDVKSLVEKLGESVSYYKVGMELFYSVGGEVVRWLRGQGKHVFLDLKLTTSRTLWPAGFARSWTSAQTSSMSTRAAATR